jgi:hypothetical protein
MLDRTNTRRLAKRERRRRYEARQQEGVVVVGVPIDASVYSMLIRLHRCSERDLTDRRLVGEAVGRLLIETARRMGL